MAAQTSPIQAPPDTVEIIRLPRMVDTGTYPAQVPYGGMGKPVNQNGFSDHFPIGMQVREAD